MQLTSPCVDNIPVAVFSLLTCVWNYFFRELKRRFYTFFGAWWTHVSIILSRVCLVKPHRSHPHVSLASIFNNFSGWASTLLIIGDPQRRFLVCWARIIITTANHQPTHLPQSFISKSLKNVAKDAHNSFSAAHFVLIGTRKVRLSEPKTILCVPVFTALWPSSAYGGTQVASILQKQRKKSVEMKKENRLVNTGSVSSPSVSKSFLFVFGFFFFFGSGFGLAENYVAMEVKKIFFFR